MDGFGDSFVPNGIAVEDPAAEFLAREQNDLAGFDDIPPPAPVVAAPAEPTDQLVQDISAMTMDTPVAPMESVMERVITPVPRIEPEPIRLWREEHQRKLVEKDAAEEAAMAALREKAAQELADWYKQHDEQMGKTREANRCAERELVADAERPVEGAEWERISKLCDFGPKSARNSRDVSRMRSIILQVKQNPPIKA